MTARRLTQYLVTRFRPDAIILHGSRGRGDGRSSSDWDLYLITRTKRYLDQGALRIPFRGAVLDLTFIGILKRRCDLEAVIDNTLLVCRLLYDHRGAGAAMLVRTQTLYAGTRDLSGAERHQRKLYLLKLLDRLRENQGNPAVLLLAFAAFYRSIYREWFEILHNKWAPDLRCACQTIADRDPSFHRLLNNIAGSRSPRSRLNSCRRTFRRIFD